MSVPIRQKYCLLAVVTLLAVWLTGADRHSMAESSSEPPPSVSLAYSPLPTPAPAPEPAGGGAPASPAGTREAFRDLAGRDPWALARLARERYQRDVHAYTCVFLKQERIDGKLRDVEEIEVRFRDQPKTVYMIWKRNADQAKRVLFVDSPDFRDKNGEKVARVEPAGPLIRLLVDDVFMPIHGKYAQQTSRRSIDEFGFAATLDLLERYNRLGAERGVLELRFAGEGEIDGRPTFVIERYLPYEGEGGLWPDAKMVMHIDQQWLLPTAVYSYADREGRRLLGSYVLTKVRLNPPELDGSAFDF